mmetsp:Transcript_29810/g.72679  ORF Transcript_29810/g.72679 Transcript_29810/m.72679 type:complete len:223 (+) Transcript_29810:1648-2316(+)
MKYFSSTPKTFALFTWLTIEDSSLDVKISLALGKYSRFIHSGTLNSPSLIPWSITTSSKASKITRSGRSLQTSAAVAVFLIPRIRASAFSIPFFRCVRLYTGNSLRRNRGIHSVSSSSQRFASSGVCSARSPSFPSFPSSPRRFSGPDAFVSDRAGAESAPGLSPPLGAATAVAAALALAAAAAVAVASSPPVMRLSDDCRLLRGGGLNSVRFICVLQFRSA